MVFAAVLSLQLPRSTSLVSLWYVKAWNETVTGQLKELDWRIFVTEMLCLFDVQTELLDVLRSISTSTTKYPFPSGIWRSWIRPSWYNYESNQPDATIQVNLLFLVSSTCFRRCFRPSSGALDCIYSRQQLGWILQDTVNTDKCSWWWAKISPEICRAD